MKGRKVVNVDRGAPAIPERWIYGVNAVLRRLEVRPQSLIEVRIAGRDAGRHAAVLGLAAKAGVPARHTDEAALQQLVGTSAHQGLAAHTVPYEYVDLDRVVAEDPGPLLLLDQIQDPHNLGALVRTAAAVGMRAVIVPERGAVGVTPAVEKVAAGAVNDIGICRVGNVRDCLMRLQKRGYWSVALVPRGGENLFTIELPAQPVLVLGGEGGIRPLVERTCDLRASIPLSRQVDSLNASVAGAIAMYEVLRRPPGAVTPTR